MMYEDNGDARGPAPRLARRRLTSPTPGLLLPAACCCFWFGAYEKRKDAPGWRAARACRPARPWCTRKAWTNHRLGLGA